VRNEEKDGEKAGKEKAAEVKWKKKRKTKRRGKKVKMKNNNRGRRKEKKEIKRLRLRSVFNPSRIHLFKLGHSLHSGQFRRNVEIVHAILKVPWSEWSFQEK
jgi:hypothetical protein